MENRKQKLDSDCSGLLWIPRPLTYEPLSPKGSQQSLQQPNTEGKTLPFCTRIHLWGIAGRTAVHHIHQIVCYPHPALKLRWPQQSVCTEVKGHCYTDLLLNVEKETVQHQENPCEFTLESKWVGTRGSHKESEEQWAQAEFEWKKSPNRGCCKSIRESSPEVQPPKGKLYLIL